VLCHNRVVAPHAFVPLVLSFGFLFCSDRLLLSLQQGFYLCRTSETRVRLFGVSGLRNKFWERETETETETEVFVAIFTQIGGGFGIQ
jgi:hypothetical protein